MSTEWVKGNRYLSLSEMQNNAFIVYSYLIAKGWTINAIAGMLGNMQQESNINPGVWQNLTPNPALGWGLVQWTPLTKYTDWAASKGYENDDGTAQLYWIHNETVPTGQWNTKAYPISFTEFQLSTETPEYLALVFSRNFEQAGDETDPIRQENACYWYDYLNGKDPEPPKPDPTGKRRKMPLYMYRGFI